MTQDRQATYAALDAWIDQHFDEQVRFLQALVQVPTDTQATTHLMRSALPS